MLAVIKKKPANTIFAAALLIFSTLKLFVLTRYHAVGWDESVYLTMGRHILTLGESGFWEVLRPPLWPLVLSIIELFPGPVLLAEILVNLVAIGGAYLLWRVLRRHLDDTIAAASAALLLLSTLWFTYSSQLLTGVLSSTLILLAAYLYENDKPAWTGAALAAAFLTRFPAGLGLAAFGLAYLAPALTTAWKQRRISWDAPTRNLVRYCAAAITPIIAWLAANWLAWNAQTATWWHAAFRPLLLGTSNVVRDNLWLYDSTYLFYFAHYLQYLPVTILALWGLAKLRNKKSLLPLALTGLFALAFFTWLPHNEWRFAILTLPGILALTALGAQAFADTNIRYARTAALVALLSVAGVHAVLDADSISDRPTQPPEIQQYYDYLKDNPVDGTVIVNDPRVAWNIHNKAVPVYFNTALFEQELAKEHAAVAFVPHNFPCPPDDTQCHQRITKIVDGLTLNEKLIYKQHWRGGDFYIFSEKEWFNALSADDLRAKYGLGAPVTLSEHPADRFPVAFVLEDYPSIDEDAQNRIWREEAFNLTRAVFDGVPATVAAIPTHITAINDFAPATVAALTQHEIAQNGLDHKGMPGTDQLRRIANGRQQLQGIFQEDIDTFIPPHYDADQETAQALHDLGFRVYISTPGDDTQVSMTRLDQTTSLITNWEQNTHKQPQEVMDELERLERYNQYALLSVYYFRYNTTSAQQLNATVRNISARYNLKTAGELARWREVREQSNISVSADTIGVHAPPDANGLTLLLRESANYTVESPVQVHAKNVAQNNITVCFSEVCEELAPGHFFLSMSPMVIPPPEG